MMSYPKTCVCFLFAISVLLSGMNASAQVIPKKTLTIEDLTLWNQISGTKISNDGRWVVYTLDAEDGDPQTIIYDGESGRQTTFQRSNQVQISQNSHHLAFMIHPAEDTVKDLRRQKVSKNDLPGDTLAIYTLETGELVKFPEVKSFKLPEKWDGWIAFLSTKPEKIDTSRKPPVNKRKRKKVYDHLVIRNLASGQYKTVDGVTEYALAEAGTRLALVTAKQDTTMFPGVYLFDPTNQNLQALYRAKGTFKHLTFDESGEQLAFIADLDTTKARVRPFGLFHYESGRDSAELSIASGTAPMKTNWTVSEHARLRFSADGSKLYFGLAAPPILPDTSLLEEEIAKVEVWSTSDTRLYPQQNMQLNRDKRRAYMAVWDTGTRTAVQLANETIPNIALADEGNGSIALGNSSLPYQKMASWEGRTPYDLYAIDVKNGQQKKLDIVAEGSPSISPNGKFFYWYSAPDTALDGIWGKGCSVARINQ